MSFNPIVIIGGEPQSVFIEILLKSIKRKHLPIILISSEDILIKNIKKFNFKTKFNYLNKDLTNLNKNKINLININYNKFSFLKKTITTESNNFIDLSFKKALEVINKIKCSGLINGPISKKTFLKGKFKGITEFLAKKTNSDDPVMLIYNQKLSVCPLTTHLPISKVSGKVKKKLIIDKVKKIYFFYKNILKTSPKIAVTGLNPHCESFDKDNKEKKEIIPAIKYLKRIRINVEGPYSPDTIFLEIL